MMLLFFSSVLVAIDFIVFERRLREFEIILARLDEQCGFLGEVDKHEIGAE